MTTAADDIRSRWPGWAAPALSAVVLAAVLLPLSLESIRVGGAPTPWSIGLVVAVIALHGCVAATGRWPVVAFAIGTAACAVCVTAPDIEGVTGFDAGGYSPILLPSTLCFFLLVYGVSAYARAPWPNLALGVGLLGSGITLTRLWGFTGTPIEAWAWWLLLGTTAIGGTLAAWALGRYRVTRAAWAEQVAERAAADERRRIAREMHDVVAHSLAVMISQAEAGRLVVPQSPERAPEVLGTIADTGRGALQEMRGLLGVLRDEDAPTEPQPGLADLPALVERMRRAGVEVELDSDPTVRVPPAVGLTIYRVVQEALTNVARHAGIRSTARVTLALVDGRVDVQITSTGTAAVGAPASGRGLTGMRERVDAVGGTLWAGPADGGWRVSVSVPS